MTNETRKKQIETNLTAHQMRIYKRTDKLFIYLLTIEYFVGILFSLTISPKTWVGTESAVHYHVWAASVLGAIIVSVPIGFALFFPGRELTRHLIGIGQMLMSALLIHLTGGRIETHFHVFGSLAFLGFYRDWKVLITASAVVALDHYFRGVYWPQSVYGISVVEPYRWLEHSAWVVFEDIFLMIACWQSLREMRDIAERRMLLQDAIQSRDTFVSICGHELKTPLTSLKLLLDIQRRNLEKDPDNSPATERTRKLLVSLNTQVDKLSRIVGDVLDISRIEVGKFTIRPQEMNLGELVHDVALRLSPGLKSPCELELASPEPIVGCWDPDRVEQALVNLITNAAKYSSGKAVHLMVKKTSKTAEVNVSDQGGGIALKDQERIFERYEQAHPEDRMTGLGLGLYIVRNILRAHGGDVRVSSEIGKGSTFTMELPL